jgi:hypothetical protein
MLVLLKQCLADERLPREDRELYPLYYDAAVRTRRDRGRHAAPAT